MRLRFVIPALALTLACATHPPAPSSSSSQLAFCPAAKFANCTEAKCTLNSDQKTYTCWCFEDTRYSATTMANPPSSSCKAATTTYLQSRYHPTTSYQICNSNAPNQNWAWCLGVPCTPSEATEASSSEREAESKDSEAAHLGAVRYVHAAFFVAGILAAFLSGKILAMIWHALAGWP